MEITPRYDGTPAVVLEHTIGQIRTPFLRQRRRMVTALEAMDDRDWDRPSRCERWCAKEVVAHLSGTNRFWHASVSGAVAATPTRFLVGFDPKATPAAMVTEAATTAPADLLADLAASSEELCSLVEGLDDDAWDAVGEAPPGHLPLGAVIHHALWDSWVHERDIFLPLGREVDEEPDEIEACLRYSLALSPMFGVQSEPTRTGSIVARTTAPELELCAEVDNPDPTAADAAERFVVRVRAGSLDAPTVTVRGPGADVVDALSIRGPFPEPVGPAGRWLVDGLAAVFETEAG